MNTVFRFHFKGGIMPSVDLYEFVKDHCTSFIENLQDREDIPNVVSMQCVARCYHNTDRLSVVYKDANGNLFNIHFLGKPFEGNYFVAVDNYTPPSRIVEIV